MFLRRYLKIVVISINTNYDFVFLPLRKIDTLALNLFVV